MREFSSSKEWSPRPGDVGEWSDAVAPTGLENEADAFEAMSRVLVDRFDRRGDRSSSRVRTRVAGSRGANPRRFGRRQDTEGRSMARGPVQTESGSLSTAEGERTGWISREES